MESTTAPAPAGAVPLSPLVNLRGFGGLPVAGGRVREGVLWRSDDICMATGEQVSELAGLGLRAVIDLRSAEELEFTGRGPCQGHPIGHHHIPLTEQVTDPEAMSRMFRSIRTAGDVGLWYAQLFRLQARPIVRALRVIADTAGGVLFHCAAGKDRTGVLAAAVLSCLGADRQTIVADYAATHTNIAAILDRLARHRQHGGSKGGVFARYAGHPMLGAEAENMRAMLEALDGDGGVVTVLHAAGYDDELDRVLKARLVERDS